MTTTPVLATRREQILQEAVDLVASSGYDKLTMRAVARASGIKLGALQYHFPTRHDLLRGLASYVAEAYRDSFDAFQADLPGGGASVQELVQFLMEDAAGHRLQADRLFPQLWAMSLVEPIMEELMDNLYDEYLEKLAEMLERRGAQRPRAEAIVVMAMVDGLTLFTGDGRRWAARGPEVTRAVFDLIEQRYGHDE